MTKVGGRALLGGAIVSFGSFMVFFGGSSRDPDWMHVLFAVLIYGGSAVAVIGCLLLVIASYLRS